MTERIFSEEDQQKFALLSGDHNPLHLDDVLSRRWMYGGTVVHGIHAVIWALAEWASRQPAEIGLTALKVDFVKPIRVGARVESRLVSESGSEVRIQLWNHTAKVAVIRAEYASAERRWPHVEVQATQPPRSHCGDVSTDSLSTMTGSVPLHLDPSLAAELFSRPPGSLTVVQMAELLALTRIVGMECPGLNSVFSGFSLGRDDSRASDPSMSYSVDRYDARFSNIVLSVHGPSMKGKLNVFYRPPIKQQPAYHEIATLIVPGEFSGMRALVVGGSRGLGEVTAKLLAAGGADVKITYFRGAADSERVAREVSDGGARISSVPFDVTRLPCDSAALGLDGWVPSDLYYFATPYIFQGIRGAYSPRLFQEFCDYYVSGFVQTVALFSSAAGSLRRVYYPSTVAISELPTDMGEYACAKAAGEMACEFVRKTNQDLIVLSTRLPRLDTDQTATLSLVEPADTIGHVLAIVRRMQQLR